MNEYTHTDAKWECDCCGSKAMHVTCETTFALYGIGAIFLVFLILSQRT